MRWAQAALVSLTALAGCGFHLQGVARLPPAFATTELAAGDRYTDFHGALADLLAASGSHLVGAGAEGAAVVEVLTDDSGQHVLSVSASNTPTEYEVYYTVRYRVRIGGREVLPPQQLTLTQGYSFNPTALLAKEHEQEIIRAGLARELALLVMRRLAALSP